MALKIKFCGSCCGSFFPVVVKAGPWTIGHFASLYMLPAASMPGTLEAKINFVTLKRDEIVIQITPKAYSTK